MWTDPGWFIYQWKFGFDSDLKPFIIVFILQLTEKEKQLQEERKKLMEMKKLEEQEKTRIKAQVIILTIFYKVETPTS